MAREARLFHAGRIPRLELNAKLFELGEQEGEQIKTVAELATASC
jgi:hypothetical protein